MPQKYIEYIYKKTANKKVTEISGGRLAEQINEKLERGGVINKKGKIISISKSQVNRILKKNMEKQERLEVYSI